jgi:hypothetical protein
VEITLEALQDLLMVAIDLLLRQSTLIVAIGEGIGHTLLAFRDSFTLEDIEELHLFQE